MVFRNPVADSATPTIASFVRTRLMSPTVVPLVLAMVIAGYGALLRLDSYVGKYGTLNRPAWARVVTHDIAPLVSAIKPSSIQWAHEPRPYVGGDPITYIQYGREMTSFYQPHVREPVFLAMTRAGLWALNDQDAGVSLASAVGSTLAIVATYLVGAALLSPLTGLLAALLMAVEVEMVTWGVDGWRDDTFTATVLFSTWALLRLRERPGPANASLAGVLCAISCLTRITAISFVVPAFAWLVAERAAAPRRLRARAVGIATLILTILVAPYLISCAIATGDPLLAINYHTGYYRFAEGQPIDEPMSAKDYIGRKFGERPIATIDTGLNGLILQPFITKWHGFDSWIPGAGSVVRAFAAAGLPLLLFSATGRLVLVTLLGSLVPYIFTWNVGGGGAWRFTMHAYPFFLIAAAFAVVTAGRGIRHLVRDPSAIFNRSELRRLAWRGAIVVLIAALWTTWYFVLPWYVTRESIGRGDSTSIETGARDRIFYRTGWSIPHLENITVRVSRLERAVIRLPLPAKRTYDLVLRIDPILPGAPEEVHVLFNRHYVGRLQLSSNPERVGSYSIKLREEVVTAGSNELILVPGSTTTAGSAGPRFAWLDPAEQIGVRLWYVRVIP
jgi:4-amino-4-deoxy-L-arabinose transferase-like glycosyltransferase